MEVGLVDRERLSRDSYFKEVDVIKCVLQHPRRFCTCKPDLLNLETSLFNTILYLL
jgi:hypothetical protein